jgi:hypothetical protein
MHVMIASAFPPQMMHSPQMSKDYVCGAEISLMPVIDTRRDCRALTIGAIGAIGPLSDHYTI